MAHCQLQHSSLVSQTLPRLSSHLPSLARFPRGAWEEVEEVTGAPVEKPLGAGYPSLHVRNKTCKLIALMDICLDDMLADSFDRVLLRGVT